MGVRNSVIAVDPFILNFFRPGDTLELTNVFRRDFMKVARKRTVFCKAISFVVRGDTPVTRTPDEVHRKTLLV